MTTEATGKECAECGRVIEPDEWAIVNQHDDYPWAVHGDCANRALGPRTRRDRVREWFARLRRVLA